MTQIGESVAVGVMPADGPCPFCESKEDDPKKETIELEDHTSEDTRKADDADDGDYSLQNDSGKLSRNLGAPFFRPIKNAFDRNDAGEVQTVYIWENYWVSENHSKVCGNAHHIIPGNASLAKATALLEWFADKVVIKRVRYKKAKGTETLGSETWITAEGVSVTKVLSKTKGGNIKEEKTSEVAGKVTGKVDYDVNANYNGIWLPSNNAIYKWKNTSQDFKRQYAHQAIESSFVPSQFHDAHACYSEQVERELAGIANVMEKKKLDCFFDPSHDSPSQDGSVPAPRRLKLCLVRLAGKICNRLRGKPPWSKPWVTSKHSESYK